MSYGVIEYDENGNPKCEICGVFSVRVMSHVRWHHGITAREYKKEFGFAQKHGICSRESSQKSKESAIKYNNIQSERAKSRAVKFEKGHLGRSKEMIPEQTRIGLVERGRIWGKTAYKHTVRFNNIKYKYFNRIQKEINEVDEYCKRRYKDQYDEDIISELKVIALEKGVFEDRGIKISTWLIGIVKKLYLVKWKYNKSRPLNEYISIEPDVLYDFSYQESIIDNETLLKLVDGLPDYLRDTLKLRMQGYTVKEISDMNGLKPTTNKSKIWEARNKLKKQLEG